MYVLIAAMEFRSLTGAPMYHYNLAKGLIELGHDVTCVGIDIGLEITTKLEKVGASVYRMQDVKKWEKFYDLAIIAEHYPEYLDHIYADKIYNICHSKDEADEPIRDRRINGYLFPRQEIGDFWKIEGREIPIPIDFKRWQLPPQKHSKYIILAPCTRCTLRRPMFQNLIERAKDNVEVWLVGDDYGGLDGLTLSENVKVLPRTDRIEDYMVQADEVAGIFIGTVTLEAWAMGLKTSVYDEFGNWHYENKPPDFEKHNYLNIAKEFIQLYGI